MGRCHKHSETTVPSTPKLHKYDVCVHGEIEAGSSNWQDYCKMIPTR